MHALILRFVSDKFFLCFSKGEIRGVAFHEVAHRIDPLLKMNKIYIISDLSGSLLSARTDCTTLDHKYEIHFGENTHITKVSTYTFMYCMFTIHYTVYNIIRM